VVENPPNDSEESKFFFLGRAVPAEHHLGNTFIHARLLGEIPPPLSPLVQKAFLLLSEDSKLVK